MARLFRQFLAFYSNEYLPNRIKSLQKYADNFVKY